MAPCTLLQSNVPSFFVDVLLLTIEILHHLIDIQMYYTTSIPILLVFEVHTRPWRISIINSISCFSVEAEWEGAGVGGWSS